MDHPGRDSSDHWLLKALRTIVWLGTLFCLLETFIKWPFYCLFGMYLVGASLWAAREAKRLSNVPSSDRFMSRLRPPRDHQTEPDEVCAFCKDSHTNPVALPCNHIFCFDCVGLLVENFEHCPLCRRHLCCSEDWVSLNLRGLCVKVVLGALLLRNVLGLYLAARHHQFLVYRIIYLCEALLWDVGALGVAVAYEEGRIRDYGLLLSVRKLFGRGVECFLRRLMWAVALTIVFAWLLSLCMALQLAYARCFGWDSLEFEQRWAWVKI